MSRCARAPWLAIGTSSFFLHPTGQITAYEWNSQRRQSARARVDCSLPVVGPSRGSRVKNVRAEELEPSMPFFRRSFRSLPRKIPYRRHLLHQNSQQPFVEYLLLGQLGQTDTERSFPAATMVQVLG